MALGPLIAQSSALIKGWMKGGSQSLTSWHWFCLAFWRSGRSRTLNGPGGAGWPPKPYGSTDPSDKIENARHSCERDPAHRFHIAFKGWPFAVLFRKISICYHGVGYGIGNWFSVCVHIFFDLRPSLAYICMCVLPLKEEFN